ncbi:MAG TPA: glycine betaine ABC transporter substrate-binding protein [Burkholderiales bacterium]|nr:glycine betaine ABC transporter substrate-binding protein [Burkholderiales bacterium]
MASGPARGDTIEVGSKRFTESYILGEIIARTVHGQLKPGLGSTGIVFAALEAGAIDVYPEYTGTIAKEILGLPGRPGLAELDRALAPRGLAVGIALGFDDSYALAMRAERAQALGVRTIGELAAHRALKLGLSLEFLARADGWRGLKAAYRLPQHPVGLEHGLAYEALAAGTVDVIDVYTTDAKLARYRLRILEDDRQYFPRYDAVLVYRRDLPDRFPAEFARLKALEGRIERQEMIRMNAAATLEGKSFAQAAALFFDAGDSGKGPRRGFLELLFGPDFGRLTLQHLLLVGVSLAGAIALGVPLGIVAAKRRRVAPAVLGAVGVVQTIPSLALFAFLIAALGGIGAAPALLALFLYALLPIVRNTQAGLAGAGVGLVQAGKALGLTPAQVLRKIELPLAAPAILAGIKTSAVINVGTATIAAFIGAGGYGERIAAGLALNDPAMLLAGAVPAAVLALVVQAAFELAEKRLRWLPR